MCTLEEYEKKGLFDLFRNNQELLISLSNSLIKNIMNKNISSPEDALNVILLHGGGINSILNKKLITKEILFKYLHNSNISITKSNTKIILIEKVLKYWKMKFKDSYEEEIMQVEYIQNEPKSVKTIQETRPVLIQNNFYMATNTETINNDAEKFPVNKLAIQFSEWFYKRFNRNELKLEDFWPDVRSVTRIVNVQSGSIENIDISSCIEVLQTLLKIKETYGCHFNPNICHKGCQGRINQHGLVLILSCGTLQRDNNYIGIFESIFSLARDFTAENNWKIKELKLYLKNVDVTSLPYLDTCETFNDILFIPQTNCTLN